MGFKDFDMLASAEHAETIVPSDANPLARVTRGVYVGTTGNLRVTMASGETRTFTNIAAGIVHPLQIIQVWATGTTATGVIVLW